MPIYDQSYAHWKGRLDSHVFRWLPITSNGIRLAFKSKLVRVVLILGLVPFVLRAGFIVLLNYAEGLGVDFDVSQAVEGMEGFYCNFLARNQLFGIIAMCLFVGTPLVARDMKAGALEVYFSKPLYLLDYLIGKFMVIACFLAAMTLIPALLLLLLEVLFTVGEGNLGGVFERLPRILLASTLIITVPSVIVLAASSLSRNARNAAVVWFAFHVGLYVSSRIAARISSMPDLKLLDIRSSLAHLTGVIFGLPERYHWHWGWVVAYLAALSFLCLIILFRRLKGVEVVKS